MLWVGLLMLAGSAAGSDRVVAHFDFEERAAGNVEAVPMGWARLAGAGLPHWSTAALSDRGAFAGEHGFTFNSQGGSVVYRLDPGVLRVAPGVRYRIETQARTIGVRHARAVLAAFVVDGDGRLVAETRVQGPPHVGDWRLLELELDVPNDVREPSVVLELGLVQPDRLGGRIEALPGRIGNVQLHDVSGQASFDEVIVLRVPTVELEPTRAAGLYDAGAAAGLRLHVTDARRGDLNAQLIVRDADGTEIFRRSGPVDAVAEGLPDGVVPLPDLAAGWYDADLRITATGGKMPILVERSTGFVVMPPADATVPGDERFALDATHLPTQVWPQVPALLRDLGASAVTLPVWGDHGFDDGPALEAVLSELRHNRVAPTAALLSTPDGIPWSIAEREQWHEHLGKLAARHAGLLPRWQLGSAGDARQWVDADPSRHEAVVEALTPLMGTPTPMVPWPALYEPNLALPLALTVPSEVLPDQVPLYANLPGGVPPVHLEPPALDRYGRVQQWRDLALRVGHALAAGSPRIELPLPMTAGEDGELHAGPLLLPSRTLLRTLAGSRYLAELPVGEGVRGFLFDRPAPTGRGREGVLLVWAERDRVPVDVEITLGGQPRALSLAGVSRPLAPIDGRVYLSVGQMPTFVIGADADLLRLRASMKLDNPLVEARFEEHGRTLTFVNPYPWHLSGSVDIDGPDGWEVLPLKRRFELQPGQSASIPLEIRFPYNSPAGPQRLVARLRLGSGPDAQAVDAALDLRLGLSDVSLSTLALLDGPDLLIQQQVTNYGDEAIRYNAFVVVPDRPRQERLILDLAPGNTVMRRYRFKDAADEAPMTLRSGIHELDGVRILNERVEVE
jgi:hypothetical protein